LTSLDVKLMTKDQYLGFQRGPRPEQSDQRQPDQAASFSHKAEALRDSASVASRIRFPTGAATRDRSRSITIPKISLHKSNIGQQHRPILDQPPAGLSLRQGQAIAKYKDGAFVILARIADGVPSRRGKKAST
jgi:hypothetical protein